MKADPTSLNVLRSDRLELPGGLFRQVPSTPGKGDQFIPSSVFCGVGLGPDNGKGGDGADAGDGVLARTSGPFVLRFVSDGVDPAEPATPVPGTGPALRDELGFAIDFAVENSCPELQEIPPP